jgi:hypothetical protein
MLHVANLLPKLTRCLPHVIAKENMVIIKALTAALAELTQKQPFQVCSV